MRGQNTMADVVLPANGEDLIPSRLRHGAGILRIVNRTADATVAEIASESAPQVALRAVYVGAGTEALLDDIGSGSYVVVFYTGKAWLRNERRFADAVNHSGPSGPFRFLQIQDSNGIRSDEHQIVLKRDPVGSHAQTRQTIPAQKRMLAP